MYSDESEAGRPDLITFADLERGHGAKIKVIGVGGAGGNAVNRLIEDGMEGVEFLVANTDRQALKDSKASVRIQLGEEIARGLGAGGNPEIGKRAALEDTDKLVDALDGSDMVFVTAGLGGGTGTGAAPIIGSLATELGALTIAVVTKPFGFEGHRRATQAEQGLEELRGCVDSVITIPNERLLKSITKAIPFTDAFGLADGVLRQAVRGISDIVTLPGLINVDFADVRAIMQSKGVALMGTGQACGENRALEAVQRAISSPLLEEASIHGAKALLVNVTGSPDVTLYEISEAMNLIHDSADPEANIIFGAVIDERLSGAIKITVIATNFVAAAAAAGSTQNSAVLRATGTTAAMPAVEPAEAQLDFNTPSFMRKSVN
ncbi:MAG TPA: cell division protein FtsZ [Blastocatellia bacterium]|nr:cell division protein FtsZ [Blastocatellia bacterium]